MSTTTAQSRPDALAVLAALAVVGDLNCPALRILATSATHCRLDESLAPDGEPAMHLHGKPSGHRGFFEVLVRIGWPIHIACSPLGLWVWMPLVGEA